MRGCVNSPCGQRKSDFGIHATYDRDICTSELLLWKMLDPLQTLSLNAAAFTMRRGADDFGSSSSHEKSKIEVQKVEGVVKPNVSPNKKKKEKEKDGDADGDGDGDTAKKKGKGDEVRLMEELIQIHLSPLLSDFI